MTMQYRIGDIVPSVGDDRALYLDGEPRWHGLIVPPMREAQCEAWLQRRGVYSFHPVTYRTTKVRGKEKRVESRYLPGYVFARFPGHVIWHRVMASLFVKDAIRMSSGHAAVLAPADLENIHAMRSVDEAAERERREAAAIRKGDSVRILSGVFAGFEDTEVVSLGNGKVNIRIGIFGRDTIIEMAEATVAKK